MQVPRSEYNQITEKLRLDAYKGVSFEQIIRKMDDMLAGPDNWIRHNNAAISKDSSHSCSPTDPRATCWCLSGLIHAAIAPNKGPPGRYHEIRHMLLISIQAEMGAGTTTLPSIVIFNDVQADFAKVKNVIQRAIPLAVELDRKVLANAQEA